MKSESFILPKSRRSRVLKRVAMVLISIILLTTLLVGGAVLYLWYSGRNDTTVKPAPAATPKPTTTFVPRDPPAGRAFGASVQSLSSPVAPGENVILSVRTRPRATCDIALKYDKTDAKDSGLIKKTADEYGNVGWSWTVPADAALGSWPVKVTCAFEKLSAVVQSDLVVAKPTSSAN